MGELRVLYGQERELAIPAMQDSRRMCFEQGKACVYEPEGEDDVIMTEWPNGVVDRHDLRAGTMIRRWPDGTTETHPDSAPETRAFPHWPRQ